MMNNLNAVYYGETPASFSSEQRLKNYFKNRGNISNREIKKLNAEKQAFQHWLQMETPAIVADN